MGAVDTSATAKYELKDSSGEIETISTLQLARHLGKGQYEIINGAWVESMDLEFNTNAENTISVSGGFTSYGYCFGAKVTGAFSTLDTVISVESINGFKVGVGAFVQFDDGGTVRNNSNAGYQITAVNNDTDALTVSPGLEAGIADDTEVQPFTPAQTLTTNNPIFGTSNAFYVNALSASLDMTAGKVSLSTGFHALASEGQAGKPVRVARGERSVTAEGTFYLVASDDNAVDKAKLIGMGHNDFGLSIELRAGSATKGAVKVALPNALCNIVSASASDTSESTFTWSAVGAQSSTAGDELSVDFW
jgi:hypothetical protein